jgi:membrane protein YdbS with pleckstrin-like domain
MTTADGTHLFNLKLDTVRRYFLTFQVLNIAGACALMFLMGAYMGAARSYRPKGSGSGSGWILAVWILIPLIYAFKVGPWLSKKQVDALKYWLDGSTLRVDQGVFFLKRKAIPLDRIADIVLAQGPIMRFCGTWALQVQTAGTGSETPEATLYGLADPEKTRDDLLKARDKALSDTKTV